MFPNEISALTQQCPLPKNSPLWALNPYFDEDGFIRERLCRICLLEATKNSIILRAHSLNIIQHHHLRTVHAGFQSTLASLRNEFWILRSRAIVQSVLYKCIPCTHERANVSVEFMGDLPAVRAISAQRSSVNRTAHLFIPAWITQV